MIGAFLLAALASQAAPEVACWSEKRLEAAPIVRATDDGYTVTIAPTTDPGVEFGCRAEVRDNSGRVVFEGEGFNTRLHPSSGVDVDGDGHGDLVVGVDTGGGNRCCWEYHVISLHPAAREIAKFDNPGFEPDSHGRTVIWTTVAFYGLGPSMAESPTLEIAEQFRSGRLVDVTAEYCDALLAGALRGRGDLTAELAALTDAAKARSRNAGEKVDSDVGETRAAAYTVVLQLAYCGREADATRLIQSAWPDSMQSEVRRTFTAAAARERANHQQP